MLGAEETKEGRLSAQDILTISEKNGHDWNSGELAEKIVEARGGCVRP